MLQRIDNKRGQAEQRAPGNHPQRLRTSSILCLPAIPTGVCKRGVWANNNTLITCHIIFTYPASEDM